MKEQHRLAAIMFTDITGYSALMSKDEKLAMHVLEKNRSIHKSSIARFNGEYIKEVGDGTLAIFQSSIDAVQCALLIQKACLKEPSFKVRIGIHTGDILIKDGDVFGDGVNIGSRIEAAGLPGRIYISEKVYDDIKNKLDHKIEYFGEKKLKNIDHPVKIYSIDPVGPSTVVKHPSRTSKGITSDTGINLKKVAKVSKSFILPGIIVILATAVVWLVFLRTDHTDIKQERIAVAVFENRTGDASMDDLGVIAADLITQGLSRTVETNVVPTTTVLQLNRSFFAAPGERLFPDYLEKLAKSTKAGVMVSGSYYLQQDKLHFQAEVKNMRDGSIIYAFPAITGSVEKPLEPIEKLSGEVIGGLAMHYKVRDLQRVTKPPNIEAYREYLIGMELYSHSDEGAVQHLIRAAEIDSLFFPPQFELAWLYQNMGEYTRADSILQIINRNREQLTAFERHHLDGMLSFMRGKLDEALSHFQAAANISPGDWSNNIVVERIAIMVNKPGIALETITKSRLPESYKPIGDFGAWQIEDLADALDLLGNYKQELVETRKGQLYYPANLVFYMCELRALAALGQTEEIKKVIERCETLSSQTGPAFGFVIYRAARELRYHGYAREAQVYAEQAVDWYRKQSQIENFRDGFVDALYLAELWDEAQTLCEQVIAEYPDNIYFLGFSGLIAASRGDREKAMIISEKLRQIDRLYLFGEHTYHRAEIAALLGERELAVELLKESFARGYLFIPFVKSNPAWEPLKDYPPFQELMKPRE